MNQFSGREMIVRLICRAGELGGFRGGRSCGRWFLFGLAVGWLGLTAGTLPCRGAEQGGVTLAGMRAWSLWLAPDAIPAERTAAEEFGALFERVTGEAVEEVAGERPLGPAIYLGPLELAEEDSVVPQGEAFRIRVSGDGVEILGERPRGLLFGVYEFFERFAGVRYLTWDHTYIPAGAKDREVPFGTVSVRPVFSYRNSYYGENFEHPEFTVRLRLNTFADEPEWGGVTPQGLINHSFHRQLPVARYGEEHPEYFALIDGKRVLEAYGDPQPCVTNPDVINIVTEAVLAEIEAHPERHNFSVSQNDNDRYCRCERCEAINAREGTPMGAQLYLVNEVARRVEAVHPEVMIGTLAYWYTRHPPKTMRPRPNVQIQLCSIECCTRHAINDPDCPRNRSFCRDMDRWNEICDEIWIWNYNVNFRAYDRPFPNLKSIGDNVRYFRDRHGKGVFMQAAYNTVAGEFSDLRNYVIAQCLWNPKQDSWDLAMEFCRLHYGPAAEPIQSAIRLIHAHAEKKQVHPGCFPSVEEVGLTPQVAARLMEFFNQAGDRASSNLEIRRRVEKASLCAYRAMLDMDEPVKRSDSTWVPLSSEEIRTLVADYIALCKKYNLSRPGEHIPAEEFFQKLKKATARK